MTTRTRVKKIDADTHFLPPVDMEELRQFPAEALQQRGGQYAVAGCWRLRGPQRPTRWLPASAAGQRVTGGGNGALLQRRDRLAVLLAMGSHKTGLVSCLRPASICKC